MTPHDLESPEEEAARLLAQRTAAAQVLQGLVRGGVERRVVRVLFMVADPALHSIVLDHVEALRWAGIRVRVRVRVSVRPCPGRESRTRTPRLP